MIQVEGKAGITTKIIAHSKSAVNGKEIITYELEYPRFIHAEFMTHRMFSRNSASSRAIPVKRMIEVIREKMATFVHWGKNQAGMQAKEECNEAVCLVGDEHTSDRNVSKEEAWQDAAESAIAVAYSFDKAGYHKQIVNRLLEPFQMMKVVCTATEFDNFFWLRNHPDAQPEINELARVMLEAKKQSVAEELAPGEWHVPYVNTSRDAAGKRYYWSFISTTEKIAITVEEALKISCSCCAQVSYRRLDDTLEKAISLYDRLVNSKPVHASALEHCASPLPIPYNEHWAMEGSNGWVDGVTHVDTAGKFWSGNFQGFVQYRQLIDGHVCNNYKEGE